MAIQATSAAAHRSLGDRDPTQVSERRRGGPDDRNAGRTAAIHFNRARPARGVVQIIGVALTILAIAAMAELVTVTPWAFGFGLAVVSAIAWCIWLEGESS
jgi:hypothetical protein